MGIHVLYENGFKYTFYDDETYNLYISGDAYFDEGQTLRKRKGRGNICKRVKVDSDDRPIVAQQEPLIVQKPPESHPIKEALGEVGRDVILRGTEWLLNGGAKYLWTDKIKPLYVAYKEYKGNGNKLRYEMITEGVDAKRQDSAAPKTKAAKLPVKKQTQPKVPMTADEIDAEKRKAVYHWLSMMESLTKLRNAGEIKDMRTTLDRLTSPETLQKINVCLRENPQLLEEDKYIVLISLLGRDLYRGKEYMPIEAAEIKQIAANYEHRFGAEDMEE